MEEEIKRLTLENELLLVKVKDLTMQRNKGERWWILAVRTLAFIIGFLPFIPNTLFYIGINDEKMPIGTSDIFFVAIGFVMLWGSANFGEFANAIGKRIIGKY